MFLLEEYLEKNKTIETLWEKADVCLPEGFQNIQAGYYKLGKENRIFAFMGVPETPMPEGGYPAVLLIHGGQGCAFYEWVKKWTDNGYVAIAPDFDSNYPIALDYDSRRTENLKGGPHGYGSMNEIYSDNPWIYFSVLSAQKAIDVLEKENNINLEKIGLVGISWGGFLSLIVASIEKRVKCVEIFYSTAFISNTKWFADLGLAKLNKEELEIYNQYFDPQNYLSNITQPIAFFAGTDDIAFMMKNRRRTTDLIKSQKTFSYRLSYVHGHIEAWEAVEAAIYMNSVFYGTELPVVKVDIIDGVCKILQRNCEKITLVYTVENFLEEDICKWEEIEISDALILPKDTVGYFITAVDKCGTQFSSDVVICK